MVKKRLLEKSADPPLLSRVLPEFAAELKKLLLGEREDILAGQVEGLHVLDRCRCGDDFCAMFYSAPRPKGAYGPHHRNVEVVPEVGMLILDVVDDRIVAVEVLYNDHVKSVVKRICP